MKSRIKYPRSEKVYLPGTIYPELRVGMRKVEQVQYNLCRRRKSHYSQSGHLHL